MNRSLENLKPMFLVVLKRIWRECEKEGYYLRPYCTLRTPWEQAKLYRQSRTWQEIKETINRFEKEGGDFLAEVLLDVGPQYGRWTTNAPPGFSWHQYGEACDCFVLENYKAVWNPAHPAYLKFHTECKKRKVTTLETINDANHCQQKKYGPMCYYKVETIDKKMRELYAK